MRTLGGNKGVSPPRTQGLWLQVPICSAFLLLGHFLAPRDLIYQKLKSVFTQRSSSDVKSDDCQRFPAAESAGGQLGIASCVTPRGEGSGRTALGAAVRSRGLPGSLRGMFWNVLECSALQPGKLARGPGGKHTGFLTPASHCRDARAAWGDASRGPPP